MRLITAGATSQSVYFEVLDSTSTTGGRKTGLAFNTSGIQAWYTRNGAAAVQIGTTGALVTQTASGAWTSAGFAEVSSANSPGIYRLDVPNAAFAAGVSSVVITLFGATGMAQVSRDVQLTVPDLQAALATPTNITAGTLTAVGTLTTYTGNTPQTGDAFARLGAPAGGSVSADVAAVKSDTGTILTDVNTGAGAIYTRIGAPAGASIAADIATVNAKTTNLPASPAAVGSAMTLTTAYDFAKGTVAMTESYAANGVAPTPIQALFALHQKAYSFTITGTSLAVNKLDNVTVAFTATLNNAVTPTGIVR